MLEKKQKRMQGLLEWITEAEKDYLKAHNDLQTNYLELTQTFGLNIKTIQRDQAKLRHKILTQMLSETTKEEKKIYANDPYEEWVCEFRAAWAKADGDKLDKQLEVEYNKRMERSQQVMQSGETWKEAMVQVPQPVAAEYDAWSVCDIPVGAAPVGAPKEIVPVTTPPPNAPPPGM